MNNYESNRLSTLKTLREKKQINGWDGLKVCLEIIEKKGEKERERERDLVKYIAFVFSGFRRRAQLLFLFCNWTY